MALFPTGYISVLSSGLKVNVTDMGNLTILNEFLLLGFGSLHGLQFFLLGIFLGIYVVTLLGNILILTVISLDCSIQTPMYFFLSNFSFFEIWYTTSIAPKMLQTHLSGPQVISFVGCVVQFYFFGSMAVVECFLLAAMSYDRYFAICSPPQYPSLMNVYTCIPLAGGSWLGEFLTPVVTVTMTFQLQPIRFSVQPISLTISSVTWPLCWSWSVLILRQWRKPLSCWPPLSLWRPSYSL